LHEPAIICQDRLGTDRRKIRAVVSARRKTQEVPFLFYAGSAFEGTWTRFMKAMVVVELALEMYASGYDIGARTHTHTHTHTCSQQNPSVTRVVLPRVVLPRVVLPRVILPRVVLPRVVLPRAVLLANVSKQPSPDAVVVCLLKNTGVFWDNGDGRNPASPPPPEGGEPAGHMLLDTGAKPHSVSLSISCML